ncbi:MAG: CdaR family protein [Candidatus Hydrothermales bacterium]
MKKRDIVEILIAIPVGVLIWFFTVTEKNYTVKRDINIEYVGLPDSLTFLEPPPKKITATIKANGRNLLILKIFKPKIFLRFENPIKGKNTYEIQSLILDVPNFVKIDELKFEQNFISVKLDKKVEKKVPVSVRIKGTPRAGYTVKSKKFEGDVKLIGPLTLLLGIDSIRTNFVSVEKREKSFVEKVKVISPSQVVKVYPESVKVTIEIEKLEERDFFNVPYIVLTPKNYKAITKPEKLFVRIRGPESFVKNLELSNINVIVNALNFPEGEFFLTPKVRVPENLEVTKIEPENVIVKIIKSK